MLTNIGKEQTRKMRKYLHSQYGDKVGIIYHSKSMRKRNNGSSLYLLSWCEINRRSKISGRRKELMAYSKHTASKRVNNLIMG
ncbi:phosphoglycerate mutase family [Cryptosporidium xiaoi]|uniref:Phosphoglycerate mutase family n=1 Tax=Cryptosporidium xiaoi TaxID=659607 RepID=A0AAV9XTV2_9CRYT